MEPELQSRLAVIEEKMDAVKKKVDRLYAFFLMILIITALSIIVPLIGLAFVLPGIISSYSSLLQS